VSLATANGRAEKTLKHAEARFHLPTLPVPDEEPMVSKELTGKSSGSFSWCVCGVAALGRDYVQHAEFVIKEPVMMLRIVADVGQQGVEGMSPLCRCSRVSQRALLLHLAD